MDEIINPILNNNAAQAKIIMTKIKQLSKFAYQSFIIDHDSLQRLTNIFYTIKPRNRTLDNTELAKFLQGIQLAKLDAIMHAYIMLILMLGTRKMELATLRLDNYDRKSRTIKLVDTKNGIYSLSTLLDQAIQLLDVIPVINEYIFASAKKDNLHIGHNLPDKIHWSKLKSPVAKAIQVYLWLMHW